MNEYAKMYANIATQYCRDGATDHQLALAFNVTIGTIKQWQVIHPEFGAACAAGNDFATRRVKRALFQRAVGYDQPATKFFNHKGTVLKEDYIEHYPPDIGAIKFWLINKSNEEFVESSRSELTGKDGEPLNPAPDLSKLSDETLAMMERDLAG